MSLTREQIEQTLQDSLIDGNTDYNLGVLAALYYNVDTDQGDAEQTKGELVTAMVYQQTMKFTRDSTALGRMTQTIAGAVGISKEELQVAQKEVQEYVVAEQRARQEAANETQPNDSH